MAGDSVEQAAHYRERQRRRGLRPVELSMWDTSDPAVEEMLARDAAIMRARAGNAEERAVMAFIEDAVAEPMAVGRRRRGRDTAAGPLVKRGAVVLAGARGEQTGKPRPWVVVQGDAMAGSGGSVLLCPTTPDRSGILSWRVLVEPTPANGLHQPSEVMVDRLTALPLGHLREVIGQLDAATMRAVDRALLLVLDFS